LFVSPAWFVPKGPTQNFIDTYTRHSLHPDCGRLCRRQAAVRGKRGEGGFGSREGRGLHRQGITNGGTCRGGKDGLWLGTWSADAAGALLQQLEPANAWVASVGKRACWERPRAPIAVSAEGTGEYRRSRPFQRARFGRERSRGEGDTVRSGDAVGDAAGSRAVGREAVHDNGGCCLSPVGLFSRRAAIGEDWLRQDGMAATVGLGAHVSCSRPGKEAPFVSFASNKKKQAKA